jgi:hypothetical protein
MRDVGFDVSFRDCPEKGGTGGHPTLLSSSGYHYTLNFVISFLFYISNNRCPHDVYVLLDFGAV